MLSSKGSSLTRCQTCAFMSPALAWEFLTTSATWEALIRNLTINQTAWLRQSRIHLQCGRPGLGRSLGGGHGNPLQYSCLQNPHGQRSLAGCSLRGHREDKVELLSQLTSQATLRNNKQCFR